MAAAGIGDVLIDRYELLAELGRGRSVVYRARDHRLGREVAIKKVEVGPVADAPDSEQNLARARREARATARITSPNVVAVYDVIEQDAALWLIM
ncbi:MAG: serine/threonine protein kinase, partial [Acidimicrobiia bacterium]